MQNPSFDPCTPSRLDNGPLKKRPSEEEYGKKGDLPYVEGRNRIPTQLV